MKMVFSRCMVFFMLFVVFSLMIWLCDDRYILCCLLIFWNSVFFLGVISKFLICFWYFEEFLVEVVVFFVKYVVSDGLLFLVMVRVW